MSAALVLNISGGNFQTFPKVVADDTEHFPDK